jgi:dihydroorotate dehydrogenase electron transfer subunit
LLVVFSPVVELLEVQKGIYLQKIKSPEIAEKILPGQFLNIKVSESFVPLLRRPFSICDVEDDLIHLIYNIHGEGTKILSSKKEGEMLNILGPLGRGFNYDDEFELAVFVAGGLGVAPFPFLARKLKGKKQIVSFVGGRTKQEVIKHNLPNNQVATDDGSEGYKGNVIELFENEIKNYLNKKIKIFACGPNQMLKALSSSLKKLTFDGVNIECEISTESVMACGFGICQGCPIQDSKNSDHYYLVCKDGPVFNINDVIL